MDDIKYLCRNTYSELIHWRTDEFLDGNRIKANKIQKVMDKIKMRKIIYEREMKKYV